MNKESIEKMAEEKYDPSVPNRRSLIRAFITGYTKALEDEVRWIPVSNTPPIGRYGVSDYILMCNSETGDQYTGWYDGINWHIDHPEHDGYYKFKTTHWIPLPNLPPIK